MVTRGRKLRRNLTRTSRAPARFVKILQRQIGGPMVGPRHRLQAQLQKSQEPGWTAYCEAKIAATTQRAHSARMRTWTRICMELGQPAVPLTVRSLERTCAVLMGAGYRSVPNYLGTAKSEHMKQGHTWTFNLESALRT